MTATTRIAGVGALGFTVCLFTLYLSGDGNWAALAVTGCAALVSSGACVAYGARTVSWLAPVKSAAMFVFNLLLGTVAYAILTRGLDLFPPYMAVVFLPCRRSADG